MTARILPYAEWNRVKDRAVGAIAKLADPSSAIILVVEDEGQIVGSWAFVTMLHIEGIEVDAGHQRKGTVARLLLELMRRTAKELGVTEVETGADTPKVASFIERLGGYKRPMTPYVLPVEDLRRFRKRGAQFHRLLEKFSAHRAHPDDPRHDAAVGRLLTEAPERGLAAIEAYNRWAEASGYDPIKGVEGDGEGMLWVSFSRERILVSYPAMEPVEVQVCQ